MDGVPTVVTRTPDLEQEASPRGLLRLVAALLVFATACQPSAPAPLSRLADSPEALARAVLEALATRDRPRLSSLALTEGEFRARVWPELPASRPERNLTADYVWKDLAGKSEGSLRTVLATLGGQRFELRRVEFAGPTTDYKTFSVSRDTELVVVDQTGTEQRLRAFGSLLRAEGGVKVFSYVVD